MLEIERLRMAFVSDKNKFVSEGIDCVTNDWKVMNEEGVRKELGKRGITMATVLAVLYAWEKWGRMVIAENANGGLDIHTDMSYFCSYLTCLLNRVIDPEACDFLKRKMKTDVHPDPQDVDFVIPPELQDDRKLKQAREKAALLNYERRLELEAKRNFRDNVRKRRAELAETENVPPRQKSRWNDSVPFAVEETPDTWEDRVS